MYAYRHRITLNEKKYFLDKNNIWKTSVEEWKRAWADVSVKIYRENAPLYQFVIKFFSKLPTHFNVTLNGRVFNVTRSPVVDPQKRWIKFFAVEKISGV